MATDTVRIISLYLIEPRASEIHVLADAVAKPGGAEYGAYITRAKLAELTDPGEERVGAVKQWFTSRGMEVFDGPLPQLLFARASDSALTEHLGVRFAQWLASSSKGNAVRKSWGLPPGLAGLVKGVHVRVEDPETKAYLDELVASDESEIAGTSVEPAKGEVTDPWSASLLSFDVSSSGSAAAVDTGRSPQPAGGMSPADIGRIYNFPDEWTGEGETIAVINLGGAIDDSDLETFWRAQGITRSPLTRVDIGPPAEPSTSPLARQEASMTLEWAGAMAPGAELVVFNINMQAISDPWSAALAVATIAGGAEPTVVVGTWTLPERTYYRQHGAAIIGDLLDQVTVLGTTVIACSGDWGSYDGRPRARSRTKREPVCHAPWPHATFPSVEPRVLSVGGTMITHTEPLTEIAWSGPLPPDKELRRSVPLGLLATSGGFSREVPLPSWQSRAIRVDGSYSRGPNVPAVVPYGRGYPDVSLMAAGRSLMRTGQRDLSSQGYRAYVGGEWLDYAGGTSVAAPIWGAIVARINQARLAAGQARVGAINPLLYGLVARGASRSPFRTIDAGNSNVEMSVVDHEGRTVSWQLAGYESVPGWDPLTGLGVPDVAKLISEACSPR